MAQTPNARQTPKTQTKAKNAKLFDISLESKCATSRCFGVGLMTTTYPVRLKHPYVEEQEEHREEETKPGPPADTSTVGHAKHALDSPAHSNTCIIERVVQLGHMCRIADFVPNGKRDLVPSVSQIPRCSTFRLHLSAF